MKKQHWGWVILLATLCVSTANAQVVETLIGPINASGGISVDRKGNLYVADYGTRLDSADGTNVLRITPDGDSEIFATGLSGASGNDFDSLGNLYQSNIAGGGISKISPEGTLSTFVTSNIFGPVGIAVDGQDTVFVANCGGNSIARVTFSSRR